MLKGDKFRGPITDFDGPADLKTVPGRTARLSYIEDPDGNRLTMTYDGSGRLTRVADNLGILGRTGLTFTYSGTRIQTVRNWTNRTWTFGYAAGNLVSVALTRTVQTKNDPKDNRTRPISASVLSEQVTFHNQRCQNGCEKQVCNHSLLTPITIAMTR